MRRVASVCGAVVVMWALLAAPVASADDHEHPAGQAEERTTTATPIKHFVYLMQEGHSFDEYFGTFPGADGAADDACMPLDVNDPRQGCVERSPRGDQPPVEIRHGSAVQLAQIDGGRMDGFVSAVRDDPASAGSVMQYYDGSELPWYWNVAEQYVLLDRFFASTPGGHVADHMFWMAGTGGTSAAQDTIPPGGWGDGIPTVFDRLEAAGISWKVYVQGYAHAQNDAASGAEAPASAAALAARVPLLEMPRFADDPRLSSRIVDLSEYYDDLQQGSFPSVAFVVPSGASSEHPPASVRAGQTFVRGLVNELMRSSAWDSSAFLLSYDDTGGAYDHMPPPAAGPDGVEFGLRVPALLISPYVRHGEIDHTTLDATAGLAFIRENWGIDPVTSRDASAPSFATAFDFAPAPRSPVLVSATRDQAPRVRAKTAALYPAYGLALLIPLGIGIVTGLRVRREGRSP